MMRLGNWKTTNSNEVNSVRIQLPYASRSHLDSSSHSASGNVSCTFGLQNNTSGANELNVTLCKEEESTMAYQEHRRKHLPVTEAPRCVINIQLWTYLAFERGFPSGVTHIQCRGSVCDVKLISDRRYETMAYVDALILYHREEWDWEQLYAARPPVRSGYFTPWRVRTTLPRASSHPWSITTTLTTTSCRIVLIRTSSPATESTFPGYRRSGWTTPRTGRRIVRSSWRGLRRIARDRLGQEQNSCRICRSKVCLIHIQFQLSKAGK